MNIFLVGSDVIVYMAVVLHMRRYLFSRLFHEAVCVSVEMPHVAVIVIGGTVSQCFGSNDCGGRGRQNQNVVVFRASKL